MESRFTFTRQEVSRKIIDLKLKISYLQDQLQAAQLESDMLWLEKHGEVPTIQEANNG